MNDRSKINYYKDFLKFDKHRKIRKTILNKIINPKLKEDKYDYGEGYFYQSLEKINLSGLRNTLKRIEELELSKYTKNKSVLDIGTNSGFVLTQTEQNFSNAIGIDYNKSLIDVANICKEYLELEKLEFICNDFLEHNFNKKFDIILSLANHHTFDQTLQHTLLLF